MKSFSRLSKLNNKANNLVKSGGKFAKDFWNATKIEGQETKIAAEILSRLLTGKKVSNQEKKFLKAQSKDLAKILPLLAIQGIPIPFPILPFIIILGKKYKIDIFPKDNRHLLDKKED